MSKLTDFESVPDSWDFVEEEEKILKYWEQIDAFKKQLELTKDCEPYTFYDGPPFATGLPHYGHICAGTIKDVVTRYASQNGRFVERRFGWDCHGLPIEYEIDKEHGIKTRDDVMKIGIAEYNKLCRSIVMRYSKEWRQTVNRLGRWIDFDRDYKTMDLNFMESVWYVFQQIYNRGLVYRGAKVMPYSNGCATVLSNFEASSNYEDVTDPSIFVEFPIEKEPEVSFVAWTTTPWTLPSNLCLAVNPTFDYVKFKDVKRNKIYIVAECRLKALYSKEADYQVIEKIKGEKLHGIDYVPLFPYFKDRKVDGCFRVLSADYVTSDAGTGVVHCAPGFGAEDYDVCVKYGIIKPDSPPTPLDAHGYFTKEISHFEGKHIKDKETERGIIKAIKESGRLFHETQFKHSYPLCWRSDTPLIYKAVNCWFIKVTDIKDNLLANNEKAYWVPDFAKEGRFKNWLVGASDWCFSRNRFWGNPIPLWVSDDFEERVCVGSVAELCELTGEKDIKDLHRESIDHLTIPSKKGKGVLRRVEEVFDCWFESGSMPFASFHYPFTTKEEAFSRIFPADFIGEGLDQTRGWFYTLNVIATAIKNDTPYKNLIVNGIVLAADGKKMSKRLKNYPPPEDLINETGADAIRLYLMNSPLTRADSLNFNKEGVLAVIRDIFLPWYNGFRFLIQNIIRWETVNQKKFLYDENIKYNKERIRNIMDKWIIAANQNLIRLVRKEMDDYKLFNVTPKLLKFLEDLTNWYIKLNRSRIRGDETDEDWIVSLNVLFDVLLNATILLAPFVPFITESLYQNFRKVIPAESAYQAQSVHFTRIPKFDPNLINEGIERDVKTMQTAIELGRKIRDRQKTPLKQPVTSLTVVSSSHDVLDGLKQLTDYLEEELNVGQVHLTAETDKYLALKSQPNHKSLGIKLKKQYTEDLKKKLNNLTQDEIQTLQKDKKFKVGDLEFALEDFNILTEFKQGLASHQEIAGENGLYAILDLRKDEVMKQKGATREVISKIQRLLKRVGLNPQDDIVVSVSYPPESKFIAKALDAHTKMVDQAVKKLVVYQHQEQLYPWGEVDGTIEGEHYVVRVCQPHLRLDGHKIQEKYNEKTFKTLKQVFAAQDPRKLRKTLELEGKLKFVIDGAAVELVKGHEVFESF